METIKRRSESPVTKSKTKAQLSDVIENGDSPADQMKPKRKNQKSKKNQLNGESQKNGTDLQKEEITSNQTDNDQDDLTEADENKENDKGNDNTKENTHQVVEEVTQENGSTEEVNGASEEIPANESNGHDQKTYGSDEKEQTNETESSAKTSNGLENEEVAAPENEDLDSEANGISNLSTEVNIEEVSYLESTHNGGMNGSDDGSHYEDAQMKEDHLQASPDTATKEESFSDKISSFLGKWTPQQEIKQDSGIISSNGDGPTLIHPYLSKVSGRRGIKDMNSSMSSYNPKDEEMKTPTNANTALDDSFRVRTDPTRLNASEIEVNSNLRKFKGKRCLNADDEPEDDDGYMASSKRRKVEDKAEDGGLLSTIFWSPFRKRAMRNEKSIKTSNPESKLSRFLSPFWFWKKTAIAQKGK